MCNISSKSNFPVTDSSFKDLHSVLDILSDTSEGNMIVELFLWGGAMGGVFVFAYLRSDVLHLLMNVTTHSCCPVRSQLRFR